MVVRTTARDRAADWYPWAPEAGAAVEAAISDLTSTDPLPIAAPALLIAAGWPTDRYLRWVRQLLESAAAEQNTRTAGRKAANLPLRIGPAQDRLERLTQELAVILRRNLDDWRPIVTATAELLAAEPGWLHRAVDLRVQALDLFAGPEALTAGLRALADLTDGRPQAAHVAAESLIGTVTFGVPLALPSLHAAAKALAAEPRASAGTLAVALAKIAGPVSEWNDAWRAVIGTLRTHPDADVAEAARRLPTGRG